MKTVVIAIVGLLAASFAAAGQDQRLHPDQAAVVAAEKAFAKMGAEKGMRESFLAFFADDAIAFTPHPVKAKDDLRKQPAEKPPLPYTLNWWPTQGDISLAGDLAYNTGPIRVDNRGPAPRPLSHSVFFSVWKKQRDNGWKVVLDLGVGVPAPVGPLDAPFQPAREIPIATRFAKVDVARESAGLLAVEKEFFQAAASTALAQVLPKYMDDEARVHRPGTLPVAGKNALQAWLPTQTMSMKGTPLKADVSISGDLGYAYGSFEMSGTLTTKGYYARVWRRNAEGQWRIVVDVISPPPPEK